MKRTADLISTNSVDSDFKKQACTDETGTAADNQMAIVLYNGGCEPVAPKKKKPCKPREKIDNGPNPPPGIPAAFKNTIEIMGGSDWRLIIQKGLHETDLSRNHNRLSMPSTLWITADSLSPELLGMFEKGNNHVCLPMIDTEMRVWESVSLRRWNMKKTMLAIAGVWNKLAAANDLKVKDVVQIWCFKFTETGGYGLAMVKIQSVATDSNISSTNSHNPLGFYLLPSKPDTCCTVASPSMPDSAAASSSHFYDFWYIESSRVMTDDNGNDYRQGHVTDQVASSESSRLMMPNNGGCSTDVASTKSALLNVTDLSSSDIDLSLHL